MAKTTRPVPKKKPTIPLAPAAPAPEPDEQPDPAVQLARARRAAHRGQTVQASAPIIANPTAAQLATAANADRKPAAATLTKEAANAMTAQEIIDGKASGRLPSNIGTMLHDNHPYWAAIRPEVLREGEQIARMAQHGVPSGKRPLHATDEEVAWLRSKPFAGVKNAPATGTNEEIFAEHCATKIPSLKRLPEVAALLRAGADALEQALEAARAIVAEEWPTVCPLLENNCAELFVAMLSEQRVGAKWTVEDLRDIADDLDGPTRGIWIGLAAKGVLKPAASTSPARPSRRPREEPAVAAPVQQTREPGDDDIPDPAEQEEDDAEQEEEQDDDSFLDDEDEDVE